MSERDINISLTDELLILVSFGISRLGFGD